MFTCYNHAEPEPNLKFLKSLKVLIFSWWDLGRVCRGAVLVVKELGFLNVRSVVALPMMAQQTVPCNEDQDPLPKSKLLS